METEKAGDSAWLPWKTHRSEQPSFCVAKERGNTNKGLVPCGSSPWGFGYRRLWSGCRLFHFRSLWWIFLFSSQSTFLFLLNASLLELFNLWSLSSLFLFSDFCLFLNQVSLFLPSFPSSDGSDVFLFISQDFLWRQIVFSFLILF